MNNNDAAVTGKPARRAPWNKGKLIGPKPPLRQGHVWSIHLRRSGQFLLQADVGPTAVSQRDSMCAWSVSGLRASVSIRSSSERIRCGGPRPR
jgi:hypothetical protein